MKRKFIGTLSLRVHYLEQGERVERLCLLDTICTGWPKLMQYFYSYMAGGHFLVEANLQGTADFIDRFLRRE